MTATIPESHKDLLLGKNFASVATLMPDGSPQVTPVWIDFDGTDVVFNTADGRQKARNLDRDKRVAVSVFDSANPYRYIQIRGVVIQDDRGRRHAHRQDGEEIPRPGHVSVPHAERTARDLPHQRARPDACRCAPE